MEVHAQTCIHVYMCMCKKEEVEKLRGEMKIVHFKLPWAWLFPTVICVPGRPGEIKWEGSLKGYHPKNNIWKAEGWTVVRMEKTVIAGATKQQL